MGKKRACGRAGSDSGPEHCRLPHSWRTGAAARRQRRDVCTEPPRGLSPSFPPSLSHTPSSPTPLPTLLTCSCITSPSHRLRGGWWERRSGGFECWGNNNDDDDENYNYNYNNVCVCARGLCWSARSAPALDRMPDQRMICAIICQLRIYMCAAGVCVCFGQPAALWP